tara:strand:- start:248 stop:577 length:330 start_codon:yes stop_codon:yes gene_type:complete
MSEKIITVELKTFEINLDGMDKPASIQYGDLLTGALNSIPEGGLAPVDMRERIKIIDKIESSKNGSIKLTEDEFNTVYDMAKDQKYAIVNQGFVDYVDYLDALKKSSES